MGAKTDLRFDVQALDRASQAFTRIGQAVERFEKRLDRLDGKTVNTEVGVKTEKAEREIGRFATDARRRLTAALSNLPDVEINGDSSDLDRDLAKVKAELAELNGKQIGVDIDAATFDRETRRIRDELARIARESPSIQVQTDTAAAIVALKLVDEEATKLDGKNVKIKVDVDKSLSDSLIKVAQLGRALGALAIPASALAAAPQLASIGAAAVSASGSLALIPAAGFAAAAAVGALTLGFQGFSDALGDNPKKAAEALAKMAPAAREVVATVKGLGPVWREAQQAAQQALTVGMAEPIRKLSGSYLPILRSAFVGINTQVRGAAQEFVAFATSAQTTRDAASGLSFVEQAARSLAPALVSGSAMMRDIGVVGAAFLPELARGFAGAADRAADFVARARESGDLGRFIQRGIDTVGQLGRILGDVGAIAVRVFSAAEQSGADFLGRLEGVTQGVRDFLATTEGQQAVVDFFRIISETVDAATPGLRALGSAVIDVIGKIGQSGALQSAGSAISSIAESAAPVVEVLGTLASVVLPPLLDLLGALSPVLVPVAVGLAAIKLASAGWQKAREFPDWLFSVKAGSQEAIRNSDRLSAAMSSLQAPFVAAAGGVRQFRDEMALQKGLAAAQGQDIGRLSAALAAFETSQVGVVASARATRDQMRETYASTSQAVQGFADNAGRAANQASVALGDRLAGAASKGVEGIIKIPGAVAEAARSLSTGLQTAVVRAGLELESLPARAKDAGATLKTALGLAALDAQQKLKDLGAAAKDAGQLLYTGVGVKALDAAEQVRKLPAAVKDAASTLKTGIGLAALDAGEKLRNLGTSAADAGRSMATGLREGVTNAATALKNLPTAAADAGRSLASNLRDGAVQAGTAVRDGVRTATDAVRQLPSQLGEAARSAGTSVATGLRAIPDGIRNAFSTVGSAVDSGLGHLGRFASSAAGAASAAGQAITTGLSRGMSGLLGALGGPWGLLITAATVALGIVAGEQAKAEQAARDHQAAIDNLAGSLDKYSGAVTQATINEKASALAKDGTLEKVKALGISTQDYVRAALGEEGALQRVQQQLSQHTSGLIEASSAYKNGQTELKALGLSLSDLTSAAQGNQPAIDKVNDAIGRIPDLEAQQSVRMLVDSMIDAGGASADLANELGISNGQLQKAQEQTRLAAEASNDFASKLDFLKGGLGGLKDGAAPTEALAKGMQSLATSAGEAATRAGETQKELYGVEAGAAAAGQSMLQSRNAFIEAATGAGLSKDAAEALANQIGLIPAAAETNFRTNATGVTAELNTLTAQFAAVPGEKTITVQTLSEEAQQKLRDMGFTVTQLPDNKGVTVTAETEQAKADLAAFLAFGNGQITVVKIDADPNPANSKVTATVQLGNGQTAVMTYDANAVNAEGKIVATVDLGNGQTATMLLDANPALANGQISGTVRYGNGQTSTINLNARDNATPVINRIPRNIDVTVRISTVGATSMGNLRLNNPTAGGGVFGYAGGGLAGRPRNMRRGGVLPGYEPGVDRIPAVLSRGEAVLVPELVRALGARRILAANRQASGGRRATVVGRIASMMDGTIGSSRMAGSGSGTGRVPAGLAAGLRDVVTAPRAGMPSINVQGIGADLAGVESLLRLLRGDMVAGSQYGPAMVEALGSIVSELRRRGSAAVSTQAARSVSSGGAF